MIKSSNQNSKQTTTTNTTGNTKQRKVSTQTTVNQRLREFFELFRCRFTSSNGNRRHSKQSVRSSSDAKKRNSSLVSNSTNVNNNNNNVDISKQQQENNSTTNLTSTNDDNNNLKQCRLCYNELESSSFYKLSCCTHKFCINCLQTYLNYQITESRISISCPQCPEKLPPSDIYKLCENYNLKLISKYEEFMLRRVLVTITDIRFCPAPDCNYAVIANGCANCPELKCKRPDCNTSFCYHCKQYWHPNVTCEDAAINNRHMNVNAALAAAANTSIINLNRSNSHISLISAFNISGVGATSSNFKDEMKRCPKCQAPIVKMDDGSCNHITCAVCGCEFCWLCMKEISDLHYLSPSGCTFWGKKPWSRKKKILWQLGTLIGAPIGIALLAGVAIPAILIGLPIWSGRKVYMKFKNSNKHKRNVIVVSTVFGTILVAPVVAALTVGIGVPILLAYVYGVVPISLCRSSGGCGVTTNTNGVRFAFDDEDNFIFTPNTNSNQQQQRTSILKSTANNRKIASNSITVNHASLEESDDPNNVKLDESILIQQTGEGGSSNCINNDNQITNSILTSTSSNNQKPTKSSRKSNNSSNGKHSSFRIHKQQQKLQKTQTTNSISSTQSSCKQHQQQDSQSININVNVNNPSIVGCESIGAYTTSLSASGSNIDRINDVNFVDDEADEDEDDDDVDIDRDSASNRALAGSSKGVTKKYKISFDDNPKIVDHFKIDIEENILEKDDHGQQQNDLKSCDSYSITMSITSANPSVIALAGSIKDNQSIDSQSNADLDSIKQRQRSVISNNNEQQQPQQSSNIKIPETDISSSLKVSSSSSSSNKSSKKKLLNSKLI